MKLTHILRGMDRSGACYSLHYANMLHDLRWFGQTLCTTRSYLAFSGIPWCRD